MLAGRIKSAEYDTVTYSVYHEKFQLLKDNEDAAETIEVVVLR